MCSFQMMGSRVYDDHNSWRFQYSKNQNRLETLMLNKGSDDENRYMHRYWNQSSGTLTYKYYVLKYHLVFYKKNTAENDLNYKFLGSSLLDPYTDNKTDLNLHLYTVIQKYCHLKCQAPNIEYSLLNSNKR